MFYAIYDPGEDGVALGRVGGEPVEPEQGFYSIPVGTQSPQQYEKVDIQGETAMTLELK